jgi:hypothetical protein
MRPHCPTGPAARKRCSRRNLPRIFRKSSANLPRIFRPSARAGSIVSTIGAPWPTGWPRPGSGIVPHSTPTGNGWTRDGAWGPASEPSRCCDGERRRPCTPTCSTDERGLQGRLLWVCLSTGGKFSVAQMLPARATGKATGVIRRRREKCAVSFSVANTGIEALSDGEAQNA